MDEYGIIRVKKDAITAKNIQLRSIESEHIDRNSIISRTIKNNSILGKDINRDTEITVAEIIANDLTARNMVTGAAAFSGNLNVQNNLLLNIGNAGTDFTSAGGLNMAGDFNVNSGKLFVDATSGKVGIGTPSPGELLDIFSTTDADMQLTTQANIDASSIFLRRAKAGPSIVALADTIGDIRGYGYDGANYFMTSRIMFEVDDTPGINDMPGKITFYTTPDGSTTGQVRMTIKNDGNVGIGTTSPTNLLHIYNVSTTSGMRLTGNNLEFNRPNNGNSTIDKIDTGSLTFRMGESSTEVMRITTGGNVGIGTTSPQHALDIRNGNIWLQGTGATFYLDANGSDSTSQNLFFRNTGTAKAHITFSNDLIFQDAGGVSKLEIQKNYGIVASGGIIAAGAHNAFGVGATVGWVGNRFTNVFTSDGGSTFVLGMDIDPTITMAPGDISFAAYVGIDGFGITTQENETIGHIESLRITEPQVTVSSGATVNKASSLYIESAPTEGTVSSALYIEHGDTRLGATSGKTYIGPLGATNPNAMLVVKGGNANTMIIDNDGSRYTELDFANNGTIKTGIYWDNTNTSLQVAGGTITVKSGNVGIGTTAPGAKLDIASTGSTASIRGGGTTYFDIYGNTTDDADSHITRIGGGGDVTTTRGSFISFYGNEAATYPGSLIITPGSEGSTIINGNVGIGTVSPGSTLDVQAPGASQQIKSTTGANSAYTNYANTGGTFRIGQDKSTGGGLLTDSAAYAGVIAHIGNYPLQFGTNNIIRMTVSSGGNVGIGTTNPNSILSVAGNLSIGNVAAGTSGTRVLVLSNGTIPSTSPADSIQLYSEDVSDSSELKVRDEAGNITTLSPHNFSLIPEGRSEDLAWSYYSQRGNKAVNVDMAKAVRLIEQLSGEQLIYLKNLKSGSYDESLPDVETPLAIKELQEQSQNIASLQLQTTDNITTLEDIKNLVDKNTKVFEEAIGDLDESVSDISDRTNTLEDQMAKIQLQNSEEGIGLIETRLGNLEIALNVAGSNINVLGSLSVAGDVDLLSGKLTAEDIEALGTVKAKNIEAEETIKGDNLELGEETRGKAEIEAGDKEAEIETKAVSNSSQIYITPLGKLGGGNLYVDMEDVKEGESFKVKLDGEELDNNIEFNWLIVK